MIHQEKGTTSLNGVPSLSTAVRRAWGLDLVDLYADEIGAGVHDVAVGHGLDLDPVPEVEDAQAVDCDPRPA
ncbi:hypothetical protein [Georgenia sp. AZ-5]|uniref:hypothetical protein n=1 Tax=Georgenia sp. AZ-5 TaxID=3367526 RepID=UPI003753EC90